MPRIRNPNWADLMYPTKTYEKARPKSHMQAHRHGVLSSLRTKILIYVALSKNIFIINLFPDLARHSRPIERKVARWSRTTGFVLHCCQCCVASNPMSICRFWTLSLSLNFSLCPHRVAFFLIYEPTNIKWSLFPTAQSIGTCFVSSVFGTTEKRWQIGGQWW